MRRSNSIYSRSVFPATKYEERKDSRMGHNRKETCLSTRTILMRPEKKTFTTTLSKNVKNTVTVTKKGNKINC